MNVAALANVAAAIAALSAGASIVATRYVIGETDPLSLAYYRYLIATVCILPVVVAYHQSKKLGTQDWVAIASLGLLFFGVFPWLFSAALKYTTSARGSVALATIPIATLAFARLFGREELTARKIGGVVLALIGVSIAFGDGLATHEATFHMLTGDGLMLLAAVCVGVYSVLVRPYVQRFGPLYVTGIAMALGTLLMTPLAISSGSLDQVPRFSFNGWVAVLFLGIVGGAIQFGLYSWALRWISPTMAAIYMALTPISAFVLANLILHEVITLRVVAGLILVLVSIVLVNLRTADKVHTDKT